MSFGRGRGRGRGGGGPVRLAKKVPYILFPEEVPLPSPVNPDAMANEEKRIIIRKYKLEHFWFTSCYHLEQEDQSKSSRKMSKTASKERGDVEIERYSDRFKKKKEAIREEFDSYLKLTASNFPTELIQGRKQKQRSNKKLRWDGGSALDKIEQDEENNKGKEEKEAKKGEDDEEEAEVEEEVEESSDDDYNHNVDIDDNDDDFNMEDEPEFFLKAHGSAYWVITTVQEMFLDISLKSDLLSDILLWMKTATSKRGSISKACGDTSWMINLCIISLQVLVGSNFCLSSCRVLS